MQLSIRMQAVADMVTPGGRIADIGTDHGYVPIYLVEQNKTDHAIAMDVRKGPLARAGENIVRFGCSDRIETRLSDGLAMLKPGEADTVIIAGMGGLLTIRILEGTSECQRMYPAAAVRSGQSPAVSASAWFSDRTGKDADR